tara:strand:+ start:1345 stop:1899 length:555 start_codon:yes stop_codon:yes gene_type:complete
MDNQHTYCNFTKDLKKNNVHKIYHDTQYGFPVESDNELFGRLILEINQAGLSWSTILNKQKNFRKAYSNFSIKKIANYNNNERIRLLNNVGIVRNRLKIDAVIYNAQILLEIQKKFGSFQSWLNNNHPKTKNEWVILFKKTFKFTGGEITNEFLISTGYLDGAHQKNCNIYKKILKEKPKWSSN